MASKEESKTSTTAETIHDSLAAISDDKSASAKIPEIIISGPSDTNPDATPAMYPKETPTDANTAPPTCTAGDALEVKLIINDFCSKVTPATYAAAVKRSTAAHRAAFDKVSREVAGAAASVDESAKKDVSGVRPITGSRLCALVLELGSAVEFSRTLEGGGGTEAERQEILRVAKMAADVVSFWGVGGPAE